MELKFIKRKSHSLQIMCIFVIQIMVLSRFFLNVIVFPYRFAALFFVLHPALCISVNTVNQVTIVHCSCGTKRILKYERFNIKEKKATKQLSNIHYHQIFRQETS